MCSFHLYGSPMIPTVNKIVDKGTAFYTLRWSRIIKVDKYEIITKVPAMAGIFELYYMDEKKKLVRFYMGKIWIGGLRTKIRKLTDPIIEEDTQRREVLEKYDCYYRYCVIEHQDDLDDVFYFFAGRYNPEENKAEHSGRYEDIYVKEIDPDNLVTI